MTSQLAGRRTVGIFIEAGNPFVAVTTARGIVIKAVCRNFDYPLRYRRDRPIIILIRPWLAIAPPGEMSREPTVETPVQTLYDCVSPSSADLETGVIFASGCGRSADGRERDPSVYTLVSISTRSYWREKHFSSYICNLEN